MKGLFGGNPVIIPMYKVGVQENSFNLLDGRHPESVLLNPGGADWGRSP